MTDQETPKPPVKETEVGDIAGLNELWRIRRALGIPYIFLLISKRRKYASFWYDMWTTETDLSSEAVEKMKEMFDGYLQANKGVLRRKNSYCAFDPTSGFFPDMELSKARELAGEIAKIVRDPKNHISLREELP